VTTAAAAADRESHAYDLFILVLTLVSLFVMVLLLLPVSQPTADLLTFYDNGICVIFLADFLFRLRRANPKRQYFIYERGWLDLLGSIPSLGILRYTGLLRLARLSRLARLARLFSRDNRQLLMNDLIRNRGQYAAFITFMAASIVLIGASVLVLQFESASPDANITTGGDAFWWGIVTLTTVGYGDKFPVTPGGRLTAVVVMLAGVGIIGSLASILASVLVPSASEVAASAAEADDETTGAVPAEAGTDTADELRALRAELATMHEQLNVLVAAQSPTASGATESG
jgi:voltage-gated potassium channel